MVEDQRRRRSTSWPMYMVGGGGGAKGTRLEQLIFRSDYVLEGNLVKALFSRKAKYNW